MFGFTEGTGGPRGGGTTGLWCHPTLGTVVTPHQFTAPRGVFWALGRERDAKVTKGRRGGEEAVLPFRSSSHGGQRAI